LFNHKPSLEKEKLLVQEERVECNHPKAHNHLNSLMALSNLLELMRTMSHQQTSKFIRELLLKKHQQKMFSCGPHLRGPEDLTGFPQFPAGNKSLCCKYLTREMWEKYQFSKDKMNFTFKEAIFSGC